MNSIISADWYKDRLTDKQLDELENPPTTTEKARLKKVSHRRKHRPQSQQQPQEEEEWAEWALASDQHSPLLIVSTGVLLYPNFNFISHA